MIAVTGASGFIGKTLCAALAAAGHEVVPIELRASGRHLGLEGTRALVHLAGIAHRRGVRPAELQRANVELSVQLGRAAPASGTRTIFMRSVKVHGEEAGAPFTEASPITPADAYAESKARAEELLAAIPGLRLTVLRPPLVYGAHVKANFLALMKAIARGIPLPLATVANGRSLIYVGNLADAILRCIVKADLAGRAYLVCDGPALSTPELCRRLGDALGRRARLFSLPVSLLELVPGATRLTRSLEVDDTAIRRELGWRPPYSLDEGLRATADWYRGR
jgi:nucleoside-diphosphate-sugar epimerase